MPEASWRLQMWIFFIYQRMYACIWACVIILTDENVWQEEQIWDCRDLILTLGGALCLAKRPLPLHQLNKAAETEVCTLFTSLQRPLSCVITVSDDRWNGDPVIESEFISYNLKNIQFYFCLHSKKYIQLYVKVSKMRFYFSDWLFFSMKWIFSWDLL